MKFFIVPLDTNEGYEAFQFVWTALTQYQREGIQSIEQLSVELELRKKFEAMSHDRGTGGGERVLNEECFVGLTQEEQELLTVCFANTPWQPNVLAHVWAAASHFGLRTEKLDLAVVKSLETGKIVPPSEA